jgi:probable O-glycosylation ligase (exosortase A-associated)
MVINSLERLNKLIWLIFLSVGFYGIKGGVFTLVTGGGSKVWGPDSSFIGDNNSLACALLMIMPLGFYLMKTTLNSRIKTGLIGAIGLIGVSVLGSNSRGALLSLLALLLFWMKNVPGKQKIVALVVTIFIGIIAIAFMPQSYWERMNTVKTYDQDTSAMGRVNAWWCAYNLAADRFMGAGFDYATPYAFKMYAPNPLDLHTAHSIFFQVLGDHGFVGLGLFLLILLGAWLVLQSTIRATSKNENLVSANILARMLQLSLIAYMTAGAFLSLTYYDLYWQLVATSVILNTLVKKGQAEKIEPAIRQTVTRKAAQFVRQCK